MHDAALVDCRRRVDELLRRPVLVEPKDCIASDEKMCVRRNIVELTESDAVALRAGGLRTGAVIGCAVQDCAARLEPAAESGVGSTQRKVILALRKPIHSMR